MSTDTVKGWVKEKGGEARAVVDHAVGDKKGEAAGRKDQVEGNIQKNYGKLKDSLKDLADDE